MKYYVVADVHGFYTELMAVLKGKGYFEDKNPHKLIICGDVFDRGEEAKQMQEFVLDLMNKDEREELSENLTTRVILLKCIT